MPNADFESHHIEGYAHQAQFGRGHFSVPLISHVEGNLWQGGCIGGLRLPDDFRYVVSLYPWEKYLLPDGCERREHRLYDSAESGLAVDALVKIAREVNDFRARGKTLVHCQAGLNRSGLIAGLALVLSGTPADEAIALLRASRCEVVLCNEAFERLLRDFDPENYGTEGAANAPGASDAEETRDGTAA